MKTLKTVLFAIAIFQPIIFMAQSTEHSHGTVARAGTTWEPINLTDNGGNKQNGVEFYKLSTNCNAARVNLMKLTNTNNYAVKVAFQFDPNGTVQYVRVPAKGSVEGSCNSTDTNAAKLVVTPPQGKTKEEMEKIKQQIAASISVSQVQ